MILIAALAAAAVVTTIVCFSFWDTIRDWLLNIAEKVKAKIQKAVYGVKLFATRVAGKLKKVSKNYVRTGTEWEEVVVTKEITENEVPDFILALEEGREVELTEELENTLAS